MRRLSPAEAREVRILRATGFTFQDLADVYGVCKTAISKVVHGETHPWAGGPIEPNIPLADREPPAHGTPGRYGPHHGCRCDICRAGNAERCRQGRAAKRKREAEANGDLAPSETAEGPVPGGMGERRVRGELAGPVHLA